jgi:hypothetical protein
VLPVTPAITTDDVWVTAFGFSQASLPLVLEEFQKCGEIVVWGTFGSPPTANFIHIKFTDRWAGRGARRSREGRGRAALARRRQHHAPGCGCCCSSCSCAPAPSSLGPKLADRLHRLLGAMIARRPPDLPPGRQDAASAAQPHDSPPAPGHYTPPCTRRYSAQRALLKDHEQLAPGLVVGVKTLSVQHKADVAQHALGSPAMQVRTAASHLCRCSQPMRHAETHLALTCGAQAEAALRPHPRITQPLAFAARRPATSKGEWAAKGQDDASPPPPRTRDGRRADYGGCSLPPPPAAQVRQPAVPLRTYTINAASKDMMPRPGKGLLAKFQEFVIGM